MSPREGTVTSAREALLQLPDLGQADEVGEPSNVGRSGRAARGVPSAGIAASGPRNAGVAASSVPIGKITMRKPSSAIRGGESGGVLPPSAQLNSSGTSASSRRPRDVVLAGPAPRRTGRRRRRRRYARARAIAASSPSTARRVGAGDQQEVGRSRRAATAARDLPGHLGDGDQRPCRSMWPHFFGVTWSSRWSARDTGLLVGLHGADHVDRVAVAGVSVGDHRQRRRPRRSGGRCRPSRLRSGARRPDGRAARRSEPKPVM